MVADQQPARGESQEGKGLGEADLVRLIEDQPVEHLGFLAGERDAVHGAEDHVGTPHPWVVGLDDAGAELRIDLFGLGDANHAQRVQSLQTLLRVVDRRVRVGRHQDPDAGIARDQLANRLDDRGRLPRPGRSLDQLHAPGEEVDGVAHGLLLAGVEAIVEGLKVARARRQHLVGRNQERGDAPQADVARRETIEGSLLNLDDGGDRLRPDRARAELTFLAQLDEPAAAAALAPQQGTFAIGAVTGANDDAVALLEATPAAEDEHRAGAAVAVGGAADGALRAGHLQALALATDDAFGLDLVRPGILLSLPGEPLPLVVGEGLAGQDEGQLCRLLQRRQLPADPVLLRDVRCGLGDGLRDFQRQDVSRILGRVRIGLHSLHHKRHIAPRQPKELAGQSESLDGGLGAFLEVEGVAHRRVLDIDVAVTLGGLGQQGDQGLLADVGEQGFGLALRGGADQQTHGGNIRGSVGKRGPRDNRR